MSDDRRVVAYQPSLFGGEKPCYGWRPTFYRWTFCGVPIAPDDAAKRQAKLMRRDTLSGAALAALTDHPGGTA